MTGPQKETPGAGEQTGRELIALAQYAALALLAKIFGAPFWFFEQRRGQLADRLDNKRSAQ